MQNKYIKDILLGSYKNIIIDDSNILVCSDLISDITVLDISVFVIKKNGDCVKLEQQDIFYFRSIDELNTITIKDPDTRQLKTYIAKTTNVVLEEYDRRMDSLFEYNGNIVCQTLGKDWLTLRTTIIDKYGNVKIDVKAKEPPLFCEVQPRMQILADDNSIYGIMGNGLVVKREPTNSMWEPVDKNDIDTHQLYDFYDY